MKRTLLRAASLLALAFVLSTPSLAGPPVQDPAQDKFWLDLESFRKFTQSVQAFYEKYRGHRKDDPKLARLCSEMQMTIAIRGAEIRRLSKSIDRFEDAARPLLEAAPHDIEEAWKRWKLVCVGVKAAKPVIRAVPNETPARPEFPSVEALKPLRSLLAKNSDPLYESSWNDVSPNHLARTSSDDNQVIEVLLGAPEKYDQALPPAPLLTFGSSRDWEQRYAQGRFAMTPAEAGKADAAIEDKIRRKYDLLVLDTKRRGTATEVARLQDRISAEIAEAKAKPKTVEAITERAFARQFEKDARIRVSPVDAAGVSTITYTSLGGASEAVGINLRVSRAGLASGTHCKLYQVDGAPALFCATIDRGLCELLVQRSRENLAHWIASGEEVPVPTADSSENPLLKARKYLPTSVFGLLSNGGRVRYLVSSEAFMAAAQAEYEAGLTLCRNSFPALFAAKAETPRNGSVYPGSAGATEVRTQAEPSATQPRAESARD